MTVVETATRASGIPAPAAPRIVKFVTVKRNVALAGRSYGHWWIELDDDESYGWWPGRHPLTFRDVLAGGPGVLNGIGISPYGTSTRDPSHGLPADYEFHPVLVRSCHDDQILADIRRFAQSFVGGWRWSTRRTMNCRLFQLACSTPSASSTAPATTAPAAPAAPLWHPYDAPRHGSPDSGHGPATSHAPANESATSTPDVDSALRLLWGRAGLQAQFYSGTSVAGTG